MKQLVGILLCGLLLLGVQGGMAQAQGRTFKNSIGMEFVLIPAGRFTSTWKAKNDFGEETQQQRVVTISKPFYLGKYEVTQEQWVAVMGEGSNRSRFKGRTNPVERVSWDDAQEFIKKLNEEEGGNKYRLPTEGEWEHAARAGSDTEWFFGNDRKALEQYAWFEGNSRKSTHPVGQKNPNPWGLYDIYGNVQEWVEDWWAEFKAETVTDPKGSVENFYRLRVHRGGGFDSYAGGCRSADRGHSSPGSKSGNRGMSYPNLGFRVAFSPGH